MSLDLVCLDALVLDGKALLLEFGGGVGLGEADHVGDHIATPLLGRIAESEIGPQGGDADDNEGHEGANDLSMLAFLLVTLGTAALMSLLRLARLGTVSKGVTERLEPVAV